LNIPNPSPRPSTRRSWLLAGLVLLLVGGAVFTCTRWKTAPAGAAPAANVTFSAGRVSSGFVRALACSPDGKVVATAGIRGSRNKQTGEIKLWDAATGRLQTVLPGYAKFVYAIAFAPDNRTLALGQAKEGEFGQAALWNLSAAKVRVALPVQHESVTALAFSPDGKLLASGALDGVVRISQAANGRQQALLLGHRSIISSLAFSADGKLLATGSWDKTVRLWRVRDARLVCILHLPWAVWSVALAPDGLTLIAAGDDPVARVFDAVTGAAWGPPLTGHQGTVNSVAYSSDGLLMATGSEDQTVKLWSVPTHQCIATYTGHTGGVNVVAFSPDHQRVVSAGNDNTLRLWDVKPAK
jgi:WD40 repeat protein